MHEPLAQLLERTYSAAECEVIYRLIRGCGQVRHFAADPIPTAGPSDRAAEGGAIHPGGSRPGHGRRNTQMAYGVGLVFDSHTEARIKEVWGRLASQGLPPPLA